MGKDRLAENWIKWSNLAGITDATVSTDVDGCEIFFKSSEASVCLRCVENRWVIDTIDDRGQQHNCVASFTTYELAEKFLVWRWASVARTVCRAKQLGAELHARGPSEGVEFLPTSRDYFVKLRTTDGEAVVAEASATVYSHVMSRSVDEIEEIVSQGMFD